MPQQDTTAPDANGATSLRLPASLDLTAATSLHASLIAACASGASLVIEADAVERIATSCLQLLVACARATRTTIRNASPPLRDAVADLGLGDALPLQ